MKNLYSVIIRHEFQSIIRVRLDADRFLWIISLQLPQGPWAAPEVGDLPTVEKAQDDAQFFWSRTGCIHDVQFILASKWIGSSSRE